MFIDGNYAHPLSFDCWATSDWQELRKKKWIFALLVILAVNSLLVLLAAFGAISAVVVLFRLTGLMG